MISPTLNNVPDTISQENYKLPNIVSEQTDRLWRFPSRCLRDFPVCRRRQMITVLAARTVVICLCRRTGKSRRCWPRTSGGWEAPEVRFSLSVCSEFWYFYFWCPSTEALPSNIVSKMLENMLKNVKTTFWKYDNFVDKEHFIWDRIFLDIEIEIFIKLSQ